MKKLITLFVIALVLFSTAITTIHASSTAPSVSDLIQYSFTYDSKADGYHAIIHFLDAKIEKAQYKWKADESFSEISIGGKKDSIYAGMISSDIPGTYTIEVILTLYSGKTIEAEFCFDNNNAIRLKDDVSTPCITNGYRDNDIYIVATDAGGLKTVKYRYDYKNEWVVNQCQNSEKTFSLSVSYPTLGKYIQTEITDTSNNVIGTITLTTTGETGAAIVNNPTTSDSDFYIALTILLLTGVGVLIYEKKNGKMR